VRADVSGEVASPGVHLAKHGALDRRHVGDDGEVPGGERVEHRCGRDVGGRGDDDEVGRRIVQAGDLPGPEVAGKSHGCGRRVGQCDVKTPARQRDAEARPDQPRSDDPDVHRRHIPAAW